MAKMMKPEVKVVRFGEADVIATSGAGPVWDSYFEPTEVLNPGWGNFGSYYTNGREANQAYSILSKDSYYIFDVTGDGPYTMGPLTKGSPEDDRYYAWYNQSDEIWYTAGKRYNESPIEYDY